MLNIKKFLITLLFIFPLLNSYNSNSSENNIDDFGIITLMYHRFDENKYPSTNIQLIDFIAQIKMIEKMNLGFVDPDNFNEILTNQKRKRKVLITIDDAFLSFYKNAWPILKEKKIPFILFVSTKEIGNKGYMSWAQIKEVAEEELSHIGNHSHSHGYLVDEKIDFIKSDILKSISQFEKVLGKNSISTFGGLLAAYIYL